MALQFQNVGAQIDQVMFAITQAGARAEKGAVDVMRKEAEEVKTLASFYSPYSANSPYSHLRDSFRINEERTGSNRRTVIYVYVDGNSIGNSGRPIFEYAWLVHEGMIPYGDGSLPHPSRLGPPTGGKFLERAFRDGTEHLVRKAATRAKAELA